MVRSCGPTMPGRAIGEPVSVCLFKYGPSSSVCRLSMLNASDSTETYNGTKNTSSWGSPLSGRQGYHVFRVGCHLQTSLVSRVSRKISKLIRPIVSEVTNKISCIFAFAPPLTYWRRVPCQFFSRNQADRDNCASAISFRQFIEMFGERGAHATRT